MPLHIGICLLRMANAPRNSAATGNLANGILPLFWLNI